MDSTYNRKCELNEWLITMRWFYMVATLLIGILGNYLISLFQQKSSFFAISSLIIIFLIINYYLFKFLAFIKIHQSERKLKMLGIAQIFIELAVFTIIMRLVGDASVASAFFFLPIISASIIFGIRGAVITATLAVILVNTSSVVGYFDFFVDYLFNRDSLSALALYELKYRTLDFIKIIVTSNFYFVVAIVSGYSFKRIFSHEQEIMEELDRVSKAKEKSEKEAEEFDQNAQELVEHDKQLKSINIELNKKIEELKKSEKSIIRAFGDLQEARKKTIEERNKTLAIISNFIDPIIVIDQNNTINLLNPASKEIFGFLDTDLGRKIKEDNNFSMENFKEIIKSDYAVKTSRELKSNNPNEEEVSMKFNGQDMTYKVITANVIEADGEHLGVMKIFYNLTREKMIDKLKSEFISIAAHQLRTPLSAIKWVMKMVLDGDAGKLNSEQKKLLSKGYLSNERIINLVNDMLNVSRIEEGRYGYTFENGDILKLLVEAVDNLINLIKAKHIKLANDLPKKLPPIYMDQKKMELVMQNIIENAIKYTPEYGTIRYKAKIEDNNLVVSVKDNGVGIPEKEQSKLFTKFFRAENVVRMQTEGSGLGLFIVKNIIERHGGKIIINSQEGKGAEIKISLPVNKSDKSFK